MEGTKELKTNKGITLIALVITIIVMLILVGVTISTAVNGGLFEYAGRAVSETNKALKAEQELAEGLIDEYLVPNGNKKELISKETNYVGYYADVDGDGYADGVIYADLAVGNTKDGQWTNEDGNYTIPKETDLTLLKDYYISGTEEADFYEDAKKVITATGEGRDRFYVMALEDISSVTWYESKASDGITVQTSGEFGTGKANTAIMIATWNADTDEVKSSNDVWGQIQTQVNNGWFLPSKAEWSAFAEELLRIITEITGFGTTTGHLHRGVLTEHPALGYRTSSVVTCTAS